MEKLGLGYEDLRKRKPDIIYAALSGFGVDGPYRDRPSFAPVAEAMSGWMRITGDIVDLIDNATIDRGDGQEFLNNRGNCG